MNAFHRRCPDEREVAGRLFASGTWAPTLRLLRPRPSRLSERGLYGDLPEQHRLPPLRAPPRLAPPESLITTPPTVGPAEVPPLRRWPPPHRRRQPAALRYCQDYLRPFPLRALPDDAHATELEAGALDLIRQEQAASGDGSFHSRRLGRILEINPYYYTRLESDKAVVLSMGAYWRRRCRIAPTPAKVEYEDAVAGGWEEPEHGAVFHRSKRRMASWSWRAREAPQGLCLPPTSGHLAEWCENLGGRVRLLGEQGSRTVLEHQQWSFPGGFLTTGTMADSTKAVLPEGWISPERAAHRYAVAALPDDRTLVVLEYCRVGIRAYLTEAKGLKLNIPNDLFNDFRRTYRTASSIVVTTGDAAGSRSLESSWANIDDALGVVGLYGADSLWLFQAGRRRASGYGESLYYDEVCFPCRTGMWSVDPGSVILDCGSLVLSGVTAEETESAGQQAWVPACEDPLIRAVGDSDGHTHCSSSISDRETETAVELGEKASAAVDPSPAPRCG